MDVDEVALSRRRDTLEDDKAYNAVVTDPPQGAGPAEVWVTIPALGEGKHGPCRYQPVVGETPAAGDRCLVMRGDGVEEWWIVQFDQRDVTAQVVPVVSALPASPVDGQQVYYQADATNGVLWHLRYRASSPSSFKWEFLGGSSLISSVVTAAGEATSSTTYVALTTAGPSIALPLAGDYDVQTSVVGFHSTTGVLYMSYDIGATPAVDADAVAIHPGAANTIQRATRTKRKTGLSVVTLTAKYRTGSGTATAAGTSNIAGPSRDLIVTPVRVG